MLNLWNHVRYSNWITLAFMPGQTVEMFMFLPRREKVGLNFLQVTRLMTLTVLLKTPTRECGAQVQPIPLFTSHHPTGAHSQLKPAHLAGVNFIPWLSVTTEPFMPAMVQAFIATTTMPRRLVDGLLSRTLVQIKTLFASGLRVKINWRMARAKSSGVKWIMLLREMARYGSR